MGKHAFNLILCVSTFIHNGSRGCLSWLALVWPEQKRMKHAVHLDAWWQLKLECLCSYGLQQLEWTEPCRKEFLPARCLQMGVFAERVVSSPCSNDQALPVSAAIMGCWAWTSAISAVS